MPIASLFSRKKSDPGHASQSSAPIAIPAPSVADPLQSNLQQAIGNQSLGRLQQPSGAGNPTVNEQQLREMDLRLQQDITVPQVATRYYQGLKAGNATQTDRFLQKDKQTAALRDNLRTAAINAIHNQIDLDAAADAHHRQDAKAQAAQIVDGKQIVSAALSKYATSASVSALNETHEQQLATKAQEGFASVIPKASVPLDKQVKEATHQANVYADREATTIGQTALTQSKQGILQEMKGDLQGVIGHIDIGALGTSEAELRKQLDGQLVDQAIIDHIYVQKLADPIRQVVLLKLGVGRRAFRRSDELNEFRDQLKDAGRSQARSDIDNRIQTDDLTKDKGALGKAYYGMLAKSEAHGLAKGSVDGVMEKYADDIIKQLIPKQATSDDLKAAAKSAAYGVAREKSDAKEKIAKTAKKGAQEKAALLYNINMPKAEQQARQVTKGVKGTQTGPDLAKRADLAASVRQQVIDDDIAGQAIKYVIEEDSLHKGFSKVATIIDLAVPAAGDSASLSFELKIPIHAGVYFLIALGAEAEKEVGEMSLAAEVNIGAGFGAFGLDASARAGFYIAAQGGDTHSAVNLMSYGLYRQMRMFSSDAADSLWGQSGKSGMSKLEEAELWAAMIEQQELNNDDSFVDVGLTSKLQAEVNAGVFEAGVSIGHKRLNRYNRDEISSKNVGFGDTTDLAALTNKATALLSGGKHRTLEIGSELSLDLLGTSVGFELEVNLAWLNSKIEEVEVGLSASLPFQYGEETSDWAKALAKIVAPVSGAIKSLVGMAQSKDIESGAGNLADIGAESLIAIPAFDGWGDSFASQLQDQDEVNETIRSWFTSEELDAEELTNKIALSSTLDFGLNIKFKRNKAGEFKDWEVSLELGHGKSMEIEAGVMSLAVEKSKRLGKLAFGREDGSMGVKGGLFGIEKT